MTTSSDEKQSNLNATTEPSDREANAVLAGELEPTFLDDEGPNLDIPLFITRANARELFGLRPGETVAQAIARKSSEG
ncbi:pirin [Burkholderia gladioli]